MVKSLALILFIVAEASYACSGTFVRLRGEESEPGVYQVLRATGFFSVPASSDQWTNIGVSRMSDFKAQIQKVLDTNSLVFIGTIDSTIGDGLTDAVAPPGVVPAVELTARGGGVQSWGAFYARLTIDTLIKGNLPLKKFWFKGYGYGSSCNVMPSEYKGGKFLNFSNSFTSMPDLKMPMYSTFCVNCPTAHWFDGRYLYSPDFPVLKLDITQIYPDYPATGIIARRNVSVVPWKPGAKAYLPDGRTVPAVKAGRKTALPVLK